MRSTSALLIGFPVIRKAAASVHQRKEAVLTQGPMRALMFSVCVWGPGSWSTQGDRNSLNLFLTTALFGPHGVIPARVNLLLQKLKSCTRINTSLSNYNTRCLFKRQITFRFHTINISKHDQITEHITFDVFPSTSREVFSLWTQGRRLSLKK